MEGWSVKRLGVVEKKEFGGGMAVRYSTPSISFVVIEQTSLCMIGNAELQISP
jgi:hypothetical protein